jgi:hypothetical protein
VARTTAAQVSSLQDVIAFAQSKHLESTIQYYHADTQTMTVGGGKDCIVNNDLEFDWD